MPAFAAHAIRHAAACSAIHREVGLLSLSSNLTRRYGTGTRPYVCARTSEEPSASDHGVNSTNKTLRRRDACRLPRRFIDAANAVTSARYANSATAHSNVATTRGSAGAPAKRQSLSNKQARRENAVRRTAQAGSVQVNAAEMYRCAVKRRRRKAYAEHSVQVRLRC